MTTKEELRQELAYHTGTSQWYRHGLVRSCLYTDGVQAFAERAGAYWFLDIVATELLPLQEKEAFIGITLFVNGSAAVIKADDGNGNVFYTREIEFTDCPEGEWQFFLIDNVILLPSEY